MKRTLFLTALVLSLANCSDTHNAEQKAIPQVKDTVVATERSSESICDVNEIVSDSYQHYNDLLKSLGKSGYGFNKVIETFKNHVTDTVIKLNTKDLLVVNLGNDYGIELHVKGLKKFRQIPFDSLVIDSARIIQYYHGPHVIKDGKINDPVNTN